jgi:hypothetical protein
VARRKRDADVELEYLAFTRARGTQGAAVRAQRQPREVAPSADRQRVHDLPVTVRLPRRIDRHQLVGTVALAVDPGRPHVQVLVLRGRRAAGEQGAEDRRGEPDP